MCHISWEKILLLKHIHIPENTVHLFNRICRTPTHDWHWIHFIYEHQDMPYPDIPVTLIKWYVGMVLHGDIVKPIIHTITIGVSRQLSNNECRQVRFHDRYNHKSTGDVTSNIDLSISPITSLPGWSTIRDVNEYKYCHMKNIPLYSCGPRYQLAGSFHAYFITREEGFRHIMLLTLSVWLGADCRLVYRKLFSFLDIFYGIFVWFLPR